MVESSQDKLVASSSTQARHAEAAMADTTRTSSGGACDVAS